MEETLKNVRTVKRFTIHGRGESFIYLYDRVEQTCLSHMCHASVTFSLQHRPLHSRCVPDFAWKSTPANSPSWSGDARGGEGADAAPRAGPSAASDSERRRLSSRWGAPRAARRAGSCRRSLLPLPPPPPPPAVEMAHCSGAARLTAPVPVPHLSVAARPVSRCSGGGDSGGAPGRRLRLCGSMREERRRGSPCQPGRSIWARQPGRGGCRCACDGRRQHLPPTPHPLPDILSDLLAEMAPCPKTLQFPRQRRRPTAARDGAACRALLRAPTLAAPESCSLACWQLPVISMAAAPPPLRRRHMLTGADRGRDQGEGPRLARGGTEWRDR